MDLFDLAVAISLLELIMYSSAPGSAVPISVSWLKGELLPMERTSSWTSACFLNFDRTSNFMLFVWEGVCVESGDRGTDRTEQDRAKRTDQRAPEKKDESGWSRTADDPSSAKWFYTAAVVLHNNDKFSDMGPDVKRRSEK